MHAIFCLFCHNQVVVPVLRPSRPSMVGKAHLDQMSAWVISGHEADEGYAIMQRARCPRLAEDKDRAARRNLVLERWRRHHALAVCQ